MAPRRLSFDIGTNSVGSSWINPEKKEIKVGVSIFPAGVDESDEKRGEPKNFKRRTTRRTRITLARRAGRKRLMKRRLIDVGLLPSSNKEFEALLGRTDPWTLRREGLTRPLSPIEFGRALLHLAQRRGAVGFNAEIGDKGKVKSAITKTHLEMLQRYGTETARHSTSILRARLDELSQKKKRTDDEEDELERVRNELKAQCRTLMENPTVTFGRFMADLSEERCTTIETPDRRKHPKGPRIWRRPIRNRAGEFQYHADRAMIRDEFAKLWDAQKRISSSLAAILTNDLRNVLDDGSPDANWRHKGCMFGQRRATWDLGTLGRCELHPSERCVPHADMYASQYLVVETINNLKIIERGLTARPLSPDERAKIKSYLSGPLGVYTSGKQKGQPKRNATCTDLRELMGWGSASKTTPFRFNIEADEDRNLNTDWFHRELVCNAITIEKWSGLTQSVRDGINRAVLKFDPDEESDVERLRHGIAKWAILDEQQTEVFIQAWMKRPRPDAKRLNMSRRAVRNLLALMDRNEPWPDPNRLGQHRWLTQIEARKAIAADSTFVDVTTGKTLIHDPALPKESEDVRTILRYASGSRGATKRDRHYLHKHILRKNGQPILDKDGKPLSEPPPAPLITNPVVRRAIHEVRRHLVNYMIAFGCKPDEVYIELSRQARMGKKSADALLARNRLRNRIKNDILAEFKLDSVSSTQQRAAVERVVLAVQQGYVCPLCGNAGLTAKLAAQGSGCEVAHIIPRGAGGDNGWKNIVLAHDHCNRDMSRRTPRQLWDKTVPGGFAEGITRIEKIFRSVERPQPSEIKDAEGNSLWSCYFTKRDDAAKVEQFKKDIKDVQGMTQRQDAATKYAARQVTAYLSDAIFDGKGLPERGGTRLIFVSDGLWTSRLRREWGLYFDPHQYKAKGLTNQAEHERKEKDRGDHRHHAIDAVVIALCTREVQIAWEKREQKADSEGLDTADDRVMDNYRRLHPLNPPSPYKSREEFREAVRKAVFGDENTERPISHRPVKRKLIGALHEETLFGPLSPETIQRQTGDLSKIYRGRVLVSELGPKNLRLPQPETDDQVIERLKNHYESSEGLSTKLAAKRAKDDLATNSVVRKMVDPPPEKTGLVRDLDLRLRIRAVLLANGVDPDNMSKRGDTYVVAKQIETLAKAGKIKHPSGVPIRSVTLLRTMSDPVIVVRKRPDYLTGQMVPDENQTANRAYLGGNNHHIEIRAALDKKGQEILTGTIVSAFSASQRKLGKIRAMREAGIPRPLAFRKLSKNEREKFRFMIRSIEEKHSIVDRTDDDEKGGKFLMSLCEGEMILMIHKAKKETGTEEVGYFVVAKLDKPSRPGESPRIVLVPHWDARSATERKDAEGKKVINSKRDQFSVTPKELKDLAPPGHPYPRKIRVTPLGEIRWAND